MEEGVTAELTDSMMSNRAEILTGLKSVVIKIGSNALTRSEGGLDEGILANLCANLAELSGRGIAVTVVSSGAISTGMHRLGLQRRPQRMPMLQAAAAVGQYALMNHFSAALQPFGLHAGQILVTRTDFEDRTRYLNLRNCIDALQRSGALPIINENDAVAVDEIRFGDNDLIAAHVTNLVGADLLILLSVVDGLLDKENQVLSVVHAMDAQVASVVRREKSSRGTGGMGSKLIAAGTVKTAGRPVLIANGKTPGIVRSLIQGETTGTLIMPGGKRLAAWDRWIMTHQPRGIICVDGGAAAALRNEKSLLAKGVVGVSGSFSAGDIVEITESDTNVLGRGKIKFSSNEMAVIKGLASSQIAEALHRGKSPECVIHKDDLVIF
jgi:glutamate 5-kinase